MSPLYDDPRTPSNVKRVWHGSKHKDVLILFITLNKCRAIFSSSFCKEQSNIKGHVCDRFVLNKGTGARSAIYFLILVKLFTKVTFEYCPSVTISILSEYTKVRPETTETILG